MAVLDALVAALLLAPAPSSLAQMRWDKRVLLVSAATHADPRLGRQRDVIRDWQAGASDRDLTVVEVVGDRVSGASDSATALRRRYRLPAAGFAVLLIGKDGGTKLRDTRPIPAATLAATIDAMPMRRHGGR